MSAQYTSTMLAQFDTNVALVTTENANPAGGGFFKSGYRFTPEHEPDSGAEGLYYLDVQAVTPKERFWGTGENIWTGTVAVQLGYFRGGGDMNAGDRQGVLRNANDDCMKLGDVCENPANYNSTTTGIRRIVYLGHRRAFDGKRFEVYEITFEVEWRSDAITT